MIAFLKLFLPTFISFLVVDGFWLGLIAKPFYAKHLGYLLSDQPNLWAALLFYVLNIIGLVILVIEPGLRAGSLSRVLILGALYGLCTYATYDLTNLATIKNWPLLVTVVDLAWGIAITTFTTWMGFKIGQVMGR